MLVIGLTGGIGTGKSTVARFFSALGVPVIDADEISHQLVMPGTPALTEITHCFGPEIINKHGELNRPLLRRLVFSDPAKRKKLEGIIHPLVRQEMQRRLDTLSAPYCILSIPLLIESGQNDLVERILVVDAPPSLQYQRIVERDHFSIAEIDAILNAQIDRQTRLASADDVIVNDSDVGQVQQQVEDLHRKYLQLST